ncbi:MAG: hypothetical protein ABEI77_07890 [Halorientalis sp.]
MSPSADTSFRRGKERDCPESIATSEHPYWIGQLRLTGSSVSRTMNRATDEVAGEYAALSTDEPGEWLLSDRIVELDDWV